ncbi:ABC transporter permease [Pseudomonadota bacterium]
MNTSVQTIELSSLAIAFVPVFLVVFIIYKWTLDYRSPLLAVSRMLVQLLIIGYFLAYLFESDSALLVVAVLMIMVLASSWIALRTVAQYRKRLFLKALVSIGIGGGSQLVLITAGVLKLDPWYLPQYVIPLAGMIFANSMNSVSLCAERLGAELGHEHDYVKARSTSFRASLIPMINSLFAVGLVSLPGMMTGQILSGISPLIAARYQIMVMCMLFASAGFSSACFLIMARNEFVEKAKISGDTSNT